MTQRLPADELVKSKWIKSVSKVGVAILKDLILRLQQAGRRASLADPLEWEEDEERECVYIDCSMLPYLTFLCNMVAFNSSTRRMKTHGSLRPSAGAHMPILNKIVMWQFQTTTIVCLDRSRFVPLNRPPFRRHCASSLRMILLLNKNHSVYLLSNYPPPQTHQVHPVPTLHRYRHRLLENGWCRSGL